MVFDGRRQVAVAEVNLRVLTQDHVMFLLFLAC